MSLALPRRRRPGDSDRGGEVDQIGRAGIFQDRLQHRISDEDRPQA